MNTLKQFIKTITDSDKTTFLYFFTLAFNSIVALFIPLIRMLFILPFKLDTIFIFIIFSFLWIISLKHILNRLIKNSSSKIILFFIFLNLFSSFINNFTIFNSNLNILFNIFISILFFFIGMSIVDYTVFYKLIGWVAILSFFSIILNIFVFKSDFLNSANYNQDYGYILVLTSIVYFDKLNYKVTFFNLIIFTLSFFLIVFLGARGPLLILLVYIILRVVIFSSRIRIFIFFWSFFILSLIFYFNLDFLEEISISLNLSTRIFYVIRNFTFFNEERIRLIEISIELFLKNFFFGVGPFVDRILVANELGITSVDIALGYYSHNFFIEILLQYGFFVSIIIFGFIIILTFRILLLKKPIVLKKVFLYFLCIGFLSLFFSSSYIESKFFYLFIGLLSNFYGNNLKYAS